LVHDRLNAGVRFAFKGGVVVVVNKAGRDKAGPLGEVSEHGENDLDRGKDLASNKADEVKVPVLLEIEVDLLAVLFDQLSEGEASPSSVFSEYSRKM
jgi:hypothetical protein